MMTPTMQPSTSQRSLSPNPSLSHPERALRAHLEKVLATSKVVPGQNTSPRRRRSRDSRAENEVRDEEDGWPWRERSSSKRSRTHPPPETPSRRTSTEPPYASSSYMTTPPLDQPTPDGSERDETPPPTPPFGYAPSPYKASFGPLQVPHQSHRRTIEDEVYASSFNVRQASATCRRMEGYVSFASIEGLGAPPQLDMDDDEEEERGRRERNGPKGVLSTVWRRITGSDSSGVVV